MTELERPGTLLRLWQRCQLFPGGPLVYARLLGRRVPYTATIKAKIEEVTPGHAKVRMADRRRVRNHLDSIHAIALANLGELATGLAMMAALPDDARGIPIRISVEFLKKARGPIVAEAACAIPDPSEQKEHEVQAVLKDSQGDRVARFTALWVVGRKA